MAHLEPLAFRHLLDVGGGPATWILAFLHVEAAGMAGRVEFAAGDFYTDPELPTGADLAWVSAIVHQNSRRQNRALFDKVYRALAPGGEIMIRDIVMDEDHTSPRVGALFAVNMLVRTEGGATFDFAELGDDLAHAGFLEPLLVRGRRDMDSVVRARRS